MKKIKEASEKEMILDFLKGELNSNRFNIELMNSLSNLGLDESIITDGNVDSLVENDQRLKLMNIYRGYPEKELFERFPKNIDWSYVEFFSEDINNIFYINYDYWNELSNNTSSPLEAAKNIEAGKEIYGVSNEQYVNGVKALNENKEFPPIILLTCNNEKYLIIEGHLRMTVYGMEPKMFEGTFGYIGHCSNEEMLKYDSRMVEENKKTLH